MLTSLRKGTSNPCLHSSIYQVRIGQWIPSSTNPVPCKPVSPLAKSSPHPALLWVKIFCTNRTSFQPHTINFKLRVRDKSPVPFPSMASQVVQIFVATFVFYFVLLPLYRMFLSPLAKFPGPKLAAATLWYEFYYDVILKGNYTFKLIELHKKYGLNPTISHFLTAH